MVCLCILLLHLLLGWNKTAYKRSRDDAIYTKTKEANGYMYFRCYENKCAVKLVWNTKQPNSDPKITIVHTEDHSKKEWRNAIGLLKLEDKVRNLAATSNLRPKHIQKQLLALPEYTDGTYILPSTVFGKIQNWVKSVRRNYVVEEVEILVENDVDNVDDNDDVNVDDNDDDNDDDMDNAYELVR